MIGGAAGICLSEFFKQLGKYRFEKLRGQFPRRIEATHRDDGTTTVVVTRYNGDVTTLITPEGYHPHDDNARWVLEQLLPPKVMSKIDAHSFEERYEAIEEEEE